MQDFIFFLIPVIVAALSTTIAELIQKANSFIDKLPAWAKQVAVAAIAYGLTKASALLGAPVGDPQAMLAAALSYVFHLGFKAKKV